MKHRISADTTDDWRPTCSAEILRLRSAMLSAVRRFFCERGYLEVETPLLSHDIVVDAHIEPFEILSDKGCSNGETTDESGSRLFLQTSPEAAMKRLVAAGSGSIFQITRSFRKHEQGHRHNSEFSLIEWYGVETTWYDQMQLTQDLIHFVANAVHQSFHPLPGLPLLNQPFGRRAYDDCFEQWLGCRILDTGTDQIAELVRARTTLGCQPATTSRDDLLNILLAECIEPHLGIVQPEFVINYPQSQAALAEIDSFDPRTACRFELYANGIELCNGYQELVDASELHTRDHLQNQSRFDHGSSTLPGARRMLDAMKSGLPPCSGVALGFDRLVMVLTGLNNIQQVLPFPFDRA